MIRFGRSTTLALSLLTWAPAVSTANAQVRLMHRGKIHDASGNAFAEPAAGVTPTAANVPLMITSDKAVYTPGEQIRLFAQDLGNSPINNQSLQIWINETYSDGRGTFRNDSYPCDCGGSNAGNIANGFSPFETKRLIAKEIPPFRFGRYDFTIVVSEYSGSNAPARNIQQTTLHVYSLGTPPDLDGINLAISGLEKVNPGPLESLVLTGHFPINSPMYYVVGAPGGYYGGLNSTPTLVSQDGRTLIAPSVLASEFIESRVWLMTNDGSASAVSPAFMTTLNINQFPVAISTPPSARQ